MAERSRILAAMVIAMVLGYMPWYNFSAVLKDISGEFGLTAGDTGFILAAFQAGYVLVVPFTGWLGDRLGLKRVVFWATLATALFSTLFSLAARDMASIMALRLATGLSAGAIYVPGMALLSRWFPPSRRGFAIGAYTGALTAAYAGGYLVAAPLAAAYGWRAGVLWTSLPAFAAALVILLFVREAPPQGEDRPSGATPSGTGGSPSLKKPVRHDSASLPQPAPKGGNGGPALVTAAYMGHMWELYAFWGWLGPFMMVAAGNAGMGQLDAARWGGGIAAGVILLGAPACWLWGAVADRKGRIWAIVVAASCSLLAELVLGFLVDGPLALTVAVAGWIGFWVVSDSPVYKAALTEMVSSEVRATYLGLQSAAGYSVTIVSPVIFGMVLQASNGPVDPTRATNWAPAFLVLGLGALLAPAASLLLRRHPQSALTNRG